MRSGITARPKADAVYINRLNKIKVPGLIRETGHISRADAVKVTGLNTPTVTRLMALGGMCYGAGRRLQNFICLNIGYGIGAGIIVDGQLLMGADGREDFINCWSLPGKRNWSGGWMIQNLRK